MKTTPESISQEDAVTPSQPEPAEDVLVWQMRKLRERTQAADSGRFASVEDVKAILRKFISNG